jgi:hypothetical protein
VSVPVDLYVVVLVPSLTLIVPFARIPRVSSVVLVKSGAVPVPVAGELGGVGELEEPEVLELDEDAAAFVELLDDDEVDALPVMPWSAFCTAADSALLTRFKAVWLARLERPVDCVVVALNIPVMRVELAVCDWSFCWAWAQKFWSCCQNEMLPTLIAIRRAKQAPNRHSSCLQAVNVAYPFRANLRSLNHLARLCLTNLDRGRVTQAWRSTQPSNARTRHGPSSGR